MKIVIIGCGKVGYELAKQLTLENHDITLIDSDSKTLEKAQESLDVMIMSGNGAALNIQKEAHVSESDLLIATTQSDELNLLCCIVAKRLGCKHTISRVRSVDYMHQIQFMRDDFGLSMTVNPELSTARTIYRFLQFPSFLKIDSFDKGRVDLVELKINKESALNGKSLGELTSELHLKVLVCAVERNNQIFTPKGDFVLNDGDKINVTAPRSELAKLIKKLNISTQKIKTVMIVGGGRISEYLTEELLSSGVDVKIIEKNYERSVSLATKFPDALVINDDASNQNLLISEGVLETDALVSLTGMDEQNIVISMYAESIGVPKTVTKMNKSAYKTLFSDKTIGSSVCPTDVIATDIIRYVRSIDNTDSSIITLHRIVDGKAEAIEFIANAKTKGLDTPLRDLKLKENILIACINHNGNISIPNGSNRILCGDTVIVVSSSGEPISDLNDIFADNNREIPKGSKNE